MTAKRIDRLLLGLGALLVLISSYQLFFGRIGEAEGLKLGTLTSTLSVVKTKSALALDWRDASSGADLSENQLIYTDNESSAVVKFLEGHNLEIGENSLVRLRILGKEHGMVLSKGFIRARLEGDKPIKVQMNGADYLVSGKGADIQINIQDEKGEIGVLSGEVQVEAEGISEKLDPSMALSIDGDNASRKSIYYRSTAPVKNQILYVTSVPVDVFFSWIPSEEARIILSRSPSMKSHRTFSGQSGMSISLEDGLWYYRVESDRGVSLVNSVRVIQEKAPVLLRPLRGETVTLASPSDPVILQWKNELNHSMSVEWNDGEIHSQNVSGASIAIPIKQPGALSWRVKINDDTRPLAVWSEWQTINVTVLPPVTTPQNLSPDDVEYQNYDNSGAEVHFSWQSEGESEIEIKYPDGKLLSEVIKEVTHVDTFVSPGIYKWRLRSKDRLLRVSDWSEEKTFTVQDLSSEKAAGVYRIQLKRPDQKVTFNWVASAGATSVFELAKDPAFKTVVKKLEVSGSATSVNIPETGSYYWRSREFRPDGTINVSEPVKVIIEPTPAPSKPEKLPDLEVPLKELPQSTSIFDFIISRAYASERGVIKILMPVKEEAKAYVIRIFKDKSLTQLVHEQEISGKEFEWKSAEAGEYYWQYAVIDYWDRKSLFSDPSLLRITYEELAEPVKPRLLSPIRAKEIKASDLVFNWTSDTTHSDYLVEISDTPEFQKILSSKKTKQSSISFQELKLDSKLHFWRVTAFNQKKKSVLSNTGRFIINSIESSEELKMAPIEFIRVWKSRAFLAWNPSKDSYEFQDGEAGKIDGTAMMGASVSGTLFKGNYIFNGEILRQSGEVYEGESYLYQRLQADGIKVLYTDSRHIHGLGIAIGQASGATYSISNNEVSGSSTSGLVYGLIFRNYFSWNQTWELQGKLQYLLGEIKQLEFGADVIRNQGRFLFLGGLSYSARNYEESSGKQNSIRLSLGIGKEF